MRASAGLLALTALLMACAEPEAKPLPLNLLEHVKPPMTCEGVGLVGVREARYDYSGDGVDDAVLGVRCDAGAGAPPTGVFAVAATPDGPEIIGTLLKPEDDILVTALEHKGPELFIKGYGYRGDAPRCCPDLLVTYTYQWIGERFASLGRTDKPLPPPP